MRTCTVESCDRKHYGKGMCKMHHQRMAKRGTTSSRPTPTIAERLAASLVRMSNGCLEWTGATNNAGYGHLTINQKTVSAHCLAWELANGPVPEGLLIRHYVCDNPPCCDPEHLRPGTPAENMADKIAKGRDPGKNKTHCKYGHEFTEVNTYVSQGKRSCRACHINRRQRRKEMDAS